MMRVLCTYGIFTLIFPDLCPQNKENIVPAFLTSFLEFDPEVEKSLPDTAKNPFVYLEENNYHYENHTVVTEDGYILLAVRIPRGKKKLSNKRRPPVLFIHGIFCTFYDFLNAGPENAIGFEILEEGYDTWFLNTRGNIFSKRHITLDPVLDAATFWNFSWHEVGIYDVPAAMDYIGKVTCFAQVSLVGHSQGGTIYLALAASRPEFDARIPFSLQLAPVSYLSHPKQMVVHAVKDNLDVFDKFIKEYNWYEMLPYNPIISRFINNFCNPKTQNQNICSLVLQAIVGPSNQTNDSLIAMLATNDPSGGSAKQVKHYMQIAASGNFQMFDYGPEGNKVAYNQITPPLYNLSRITSPVAIYHGRNDYFVSVADGTRLASQIPNSLHFILGSDTNHIDVQWASAAVKRVHKPAIKLLNKYSKRVHIKQVNKK